MPRLIIAGRAVSDVTRCRRYLEERSPQAAERAAGAIADKLTLLETNPEIGRSVTGSPGLRELVIGFGASGYVALYRFSPDKDEIVVLALRHQREAGY